MNIFLDPPDKFDYALYHARQEAIDILPMMVEVPDLRPYKPELLAVRDALRITADEIERELINRGLLNETYK